MKKLDYFEGNKLQALNSWLLKLTEIDFMSQIEKFAISDVLTELEMKSFLKKNYPGVQNQENLSCKDKRRLSLLLRYYFDKNKEHDQLKNGQSVKLSAPAYRPNLDFYDAIPSGFLKKAYELCC